jgi:hypothetical protein
VFVALLGAIVWSIGSGRLAREVEGDDGSDRGDDVATGAYRGSAIR